MFDLSNNAIQVHTVRNTRNVFVLSIDDILSSKIYLKHFFDISNPQTVVENVVFFVILAHQVSYLDEV